MCNEYGEDLTIARSAKVRYEKATTDDRNDLVVIACPSVGLSYAYL